MIILNTQVNLAKITNLIKAKLILKLVKFSLKTVINNHIKNNFKKKISWNQVIQTVIIIQWKNLNLSDKTIQ
jgi:hypothetical protein